MKNSANRCRAIAGLFLLATLGIYLGGARGPYMADDFPNLAHNDALLIEDLSWQSVREAALSSPASPYRRPLAMLSFALNFSIAGSLEPLSAKVINIILHLLTGMGVLALTVNLLPHMRLPGGRRMGPRHIENAALLVTALWMLHPLFVSTVLYAVQRMTILSALFTFWGAAAYLHLRQRLAGRVREYLKLACVVCLFTAAAFLSKENGLLLPGFLLLLDWFCFGLRPPPGAPQVGRWIWLGTLTVPVAFVLLYLLRYGVLHWDDVPQTYSFTVQERLLTQFRALAHYAGWLMLANPEPMSLYHDDIPLSRSLLAPPTTLWCALIWLAAGALAIRLARTRQVPAFCLLWFLWGHVLESTILPLSPVFEHRNYLPGYGLLLAIVLAVQAGAQYLELRPLLRRTMIVLLLVILPAGLLVERVQAWGGEREFVIHSLKQQPDSALTLLLVANFLARNSEYDAALSALRNAQDLNPGEAAFVLAESALRCEHEPAARFDPALAARLDSLTVDGLRTTTARRQFVAMVTVCLNSAGNYAALLPLYERMQRHRFYSVAMYSLYGIGAALAHRGDWPGALRYWDEAVANYPQAKDLKPQLERLRGQLGKNN